MANTKFYLIRKDTDESYELSATTDIRVTQDLVATTRTVESGKEITDNSYIKNKVVTFDGVITNVRNSSNLESTDKFLAEIAELRKSSPRVLVDVIADNETAVDCLITTFDLDKNSTLGLGAWNVTMVMQEVDYTTRARLTEQPEPFEDKKNTLNKTSSKSQNTTKEVEQPIAQTLTLRGFNLIDGAYQPKPPTGGTDGSAN